MIEEELLKKTKDKTCSRMDRNELSLEMKRWFGLSKAVRFWESLPIQVLEGESLSTFEMQLNGVCEGN